MLYSTRPACPRRGRTPLEGEVFMRSPFQATAIARLPLRFAAVALLAVVVAAVLPVAAIGQGRDVATTAVVTFDDNSGRDSRFLEAKASDAVALALQDSREYLVTPARDVEREQRALALSVPLSKVEAVRLGARPHNAFRRGRVWPTRRRDELPAPSPHRETSPCARRTACTTSPRGRSPPRHPRGESRTGSPRWGPPAARCARHRTREPLLSRAGWLPRRSPVSCRAAR